MTTPDDAALVGRPSPPDADGVRWVSRCLVRVAARGGAQQYTRWLALAAYKEGMAAYGIRSWDCVEVEAGRVAPSRAFRAAASAVLGAPEADLFDRLDPDAGAAGAPPAW